MREAEAVLTAERKAIGISPRSQGDIKTLWIQRTSPLGDMLKEFAEKLAVPEQDHAEAKNRAAGQGSARQQEILIGSLRASQRQYVVFLDSLDRIAPAAVQFIDLLFSASVVCAAVSEMKEGPHFKRLWSSFAKIALSPLDRDASWQLVCHCMKRYDLRTLDPPLYIQEVMKSAGGNPFLIRTIVWQGSREGRVDREEIRKLRWHQEGEYFNMGPIYIFGASLFTLYKIFTSGTDNKEAYIFFSAIGFIVYFVFRVFRTFFLFRPRRRL